MDLSLVETTLLEWDSTFSHSEAPPLPYAKQAKLIEKNYKFDIVKVTRNVWNQENGTSDVIQEHVTLIQIKDVVVKYRPHLHMGDFWVHVAVIDEAPVFKFYYLYTNGTEIKTEYASHPHISDGSPCLGSFATHLSTHWSDRNFLLFIQYIRNYLESYNGRSTYVAGTHWKKKFIKYQLHTPLEVRETFESEVDDPQSLDIVSLGEDPMRWNFPNDIPCYGKFEVQGHLSKKFNDLFKFFDIPYLRTKHFTRNELNRYSYEGDYGYSDKVNYQKMMGYIYLAMEIGEMSLIESLFFNKIFFTKLFMDFDGINDAELSGKLRDMAWKLNELRRGNQYRWVVSDRYSATIAEHEEDIKELKELFKPFESNSTEYEFAGELKSAGTKIGQYLVMLRKSNPDKANGRSWLKSIKTAEDTDGLIFKYNNLKSIALKKSLEQLNKEERRLKRELRNTFTINNQPNVEQGTLFSSTE